MDEQGDFFSHIHPICDWEQGHPKASSTDLGTGLKCSEATVAMEYTWGHWGYGEPKVEASKGPATWLTQTGPTIVLD